MGKLTHLREQKPQPMQLIEGVIAALGADIAKTLIESIGQDIAQQTHYTLMAKQSVDKLAPAIEKALAPVIAKAVDGIGPKLDALAKELKSRAITQGDMVKLQGDLVKALGNVRIPDYSEQFRRLEASKVDLSPLLEKLDNLEVDLPMDDRPTEWVFDIKRDRNGLIESVTATAG